MNPNHWSAYSEAQLAAMKAGHTVHASRPGHGGRHRAPQPVAAPDVTEETRQFLGELQHPVPAYDPAWLVGTAQPFNDLRGTMTPAEFMEQLPPPSRNGRPPAEDPDTDAYPTEWLRGFGGLGSGELGGDGFLNRREAS